MTTKAAVAHHEAGHAVMAFHLKIGFGGVSIEQGEGFEGKCRMMKQASLLRANYDVSSEIERRLHKMIMVALAGGAAEKLYSRRRNAAGSSADNAVARDLAGKSAGDVEEEDALLNYLQIYTRNFLKTPSNWDAVKALAKELLEKKFVSGSRARKIIQNA